LPNVNAKKKSDTGWHHSIFANLVQRSGCSSALPYPPHKEKYL